MTELKAKLQLLLAESVAWPGGVSTRAILSKIEEGDYHYMRGSVRDEAMAYLGSGRR